MSLKEKVLIVKEKPCIMSGKNSPIRNIINYNSRLYLKRDVDLAVEELKKEIVKLERPTKHTIYWTDVLMKINEVFENGKQL